MIIDLYTERLRRQPGKPQPTTCKACHQEVEVCYIMSDGICGTCHGMPGQLFKDVLCDSCLETTRNFNHLCDNCQGYRQ